MSLPAVGPTLAKPSLGDRAALAAALVVAALAVMRTLVWIAPVLRFDIDPSVDPMRAGAWGPVESLAADVLTLILAAFIYAASAARARAADAIVAALALLPAVAIAVHGARAPDDAWRGASWLAGMVGAAALWTAVRTLPRGASLRAALIAVLVSAAGPLVVRGCAQLTLEHAETVAAFMKDKEQMLAGKGWGVGSPSALLYERRLMQLEASGWFGLANVMSSFMAALGIALAGLAVVGWRYLERGSALALSVVAAACAGIAFTNGSKGALAALAVGGACALLMRRMRPASPWPAAAAVAAAAAAVCAVVVRGMLGEEWGERSLLFRWQYWQGALAVWQEHPWLGTGPAGFGQAYLHARPPLAPEEVESAHSMVADWMASLGIAGLAWCAAVTSWLASARGVPAAVKPNLPPASLGRRFLVTAVSCALCAAVAAAVFEWQTLDARALALRLLGAVLGTVLVVGVVQALETPSRTAEAALFGGAAALVVHAQIETTLWFPSSAAWVAAFVAVTSAAPSGQGALPVAGHESVAWIRVVRGAAAACAALAAIAFWGCFLPARMDDSLMERAAALLVAEAEHASAAGHAAGAPAVSAQARTEAAEILGTRQRLPFGWDDRSVRMAACLHQWGEAVAASRGELREQIAADALEAAHAVVQRSPTFAVLGEAQLVARESMEGTGESLRTEAALALARYAGMQLELMPRCVGAWINVGRAEEALGHPEGAARAYRSALEADDSYRLDPLRRLPSESRRDLERRAGR